ncbi:hypothetical protein [Pseudomonas fluorescens]|uniref:hypothetical protein n=1 Tax=Pseudomonas fluorescens TaxID=294 RepID=UPI0005FBFB1B|nr:hypothetical protein [Pseudomonas fluorescens]KJZ41348.1 hypothetical protein VC33_00440 [Pseudomonas fluorescens]
MSTYISTDLNMVKALDPDRHALALQMEAFLNKGGTIEVLQGPSFVPPPVRHEPLPTVKAKPVKQVVADSPYMDKITQREIEREERLTTAAKARAALVEQVRKLAETMSYAQTMDRTGLSRKMLFTMSKEHGFSFQPAGYRNGWSSNRGMIDESHDEKLAERIKAFKEVGLSRNQAMGQCGITFKTFNRILIKFAIDYPKRKAGPHPAFFAKQQ